MHLDMFEVVIINRSPNRWEWLVYNREKFPLWRAGRRLARQPNTKASARCSCFWLRAGRRSYDPPRTQNLCSVMQRDFCNYLPLTDLEIGSIARDDIAYQSRGDNRRSLTTALMF